MGLKLALITFMFTVMTIVVLNGCVDSDSVPDVCCCCYENNWGDLTCDIFYEAQLEYNCGNTEDSTTSDGQQILDCYWRDHANTSKYEGVLEQCLRNLPNPIKQDAGGQSP